MEEYVPVVTSDIGIDIFKGVDSGLCSTRVASISKHYGDTCIVSRGPMARCFRNVIITITRFSKLSNRHPVVSRCNRIFCRPRLQRILSGLGGVGLGDVIYLCRGSYNTIVFCGDERGAGVLLMGGDGNEC